MSQPRKVSVPIYGSTLRLPIEEMDKVLSALEIAGFVLQDFQQGYVIPEITEKVKESK